MNVLDDRLLADSLSGGPQNALQGGLDGSVCYEDDTYRWAHQQAALLRAGRFGEVDVANVAAEIEDVAARLYDKLVNALARICQYLLQWDLQPARRSPAWVALIEEHRRRAIRQLNASPGLMDVLEGALAEAYESGRFQALLEIGLAEAAIPEVSPYGWDVIVHRALVWPDE